MPAYHLHLLLYYILSTVPTDLLIHIKVKGVPLFIICFFQNVLLHNLGPTVTRLVVNTVITKSVTSQPVTA